MFLPGEIWRDTAGNAIEAHGGGVLFYNETYYWYGENKAGKTIVYDGKFYTGQSRVDVIGVSCYSSVDLYNWKNEGVVLPSVKNDVSHPLYYGNVVERPKVIYNTNTKKFVMWMHCDDRNYEFAGVGVAISDTPTGPFKFVDAFRPNNMDSRDQTIFVDDDGNAYHICSTQNNAVTSISLLTDDYLKPSGKFKHVFIEGNMEAHSIVRHNKKYLYMASGLSGWDPNEARSAIADNIWGPWQELGNPCIGQKSKTTFDSQSTFLLQVANKKNAFIYMGDRWKRFNLSDSRYVWLPITIKENSFEITWQNNWDLSYFNPKYSLEHGKLH